MTLVSPRFIVYLLTLTLLWLWLGSHHSAWYFHLRSDTDGFYYARATHFLENGNLAEFTNNEYQPGAILFMLSLSPILWWENSVELYRTALFAVNAGLIILLTWLITRFKDTTSALMFLLICLVTGPILFFRFELYMFLLLLLCLVAFEKKAWRPSGFFLGLATITKIFPIVITPYLIWVCWQQAKWKGLLQALVGYLFGTIAVLAVYLNLTQVPLPQLFEDANIHAQKPVHAESLWGSGLTLLSKAVTGDFAQGKGATGIYGIDPAYVVGPIKFYNYFWILPWLLLHLFLATKKPLTQKLSITVVMSILFLFLATSKILTVQYLLWPGLLLSLLPWSRLPKKLARWYQHTAFVFLVTMLLSQFIYPLWYNQLLGIFFESGNAVYTFAVLSSRNLLIVLLVTSLVGLLQTYPKKVV